jgi:hypothetical protein
MIDKTARTMNTVGYTYFVYGDRVFFNRDKTVYNQYRLFDLLHELKIDGDVI